MSGYIDRSEFLAPSQSRSPTFRKSRGSAAHQGSIDITRKLCSQCLTLLNIPSKKLVTFCYFFIPTTRSIEVMFEVNQSEMLI
ncbi:hypothetical protein [Chamaesiphon sp. VAR_48_metabat_135_sub]|uniref:hypothetical protein n=1 Tax=Chamaesiphon sp. VAR_48_metabat_135_sub TaxID=2964699 RepID=UPI00286D04DB|nr:hypothetical protein [Chamaesiphon sp. VAR_48_metabat_135_sub]